MILNCQHRVDSVWSMTKMRQDNDVTDHTGAVYAEIRTEFS